MIEEYSIVKLTEYQKKINKALKEKKKFFIINTEEYYNYMVNKYGLATVNASKLDFEAIDSEEIERQKKEYEGKVLEKLKNLKMVLDNKKTFYDLLLEDLKSKKIIKEIDETHRFLVKKKEVPKYTICNNTRFFEIFSEDIFKIFSNEFVANFTNEIEENLEYSLEIFKVMEDIFGKEESSLIQDEKHLMAKFLLVNGHKDFIKKITKDIMKNNEYILAEKADIYLYGLFKSFEDENNKKSINFKTFFDEMSFSKENFLSIINSFLPEDMSEESVGIIVFEAKNIVEEIFNKNRNLSKEDFLIKFNEALDVKTQKKDMLKNRWTNIFNNDDFDSVFFNTFYYYDKTSEFKELDEFFKIEKTDLFKILDKFKSDLKNSLPEGDSKLAKIKDIKINDFIKSNFDDSKEYVSYEDFQIILNKLLLSVDKEAINFLAMENNQIMQTNKYLKCIDNARLAFFENGITKGNNESIDWNKFYKAIDNSICNILNEQGYDLLAVDKKDITKNFLNNLLVKFNKIYEKIDEKQKLKEIFDSFKSNKDSLLLNQLIDIKNNFTNDVSDVLEEFYKVSFSKDSKTSLLSIDLLNEKRDRKYSDDDNYNFDDLSLSDIIILKNNFANIKLKNSFKEFFKDTNIEDLIEAKIRETFTGKIDLRDSETLKEVKKCFHNTFNEIMKNKELPRNKKTEFTKFKDLFFEEFCSINKKSIDVKDKFYIDNIDIRDFRRFINSFFGSKKECSEIARIINSNDSLKKSFLETHKEDFEQKFSNKNNLNDYTDYSIFSYLTNEKFLKEKSLCFFEEISKYKDFLNVSFNDFRHIVNIFLKNEEFEERFGREIGNGAPYGDLLKAFRSLANITQQEKDSFVNIQFKEFFLEKFQIEFEDVPSDWDVFKQITKCLDTFNAKSSDINNSTEIEVFLSFLKDLKKDASLTEKENIDIVCKNLKSSEFLSFKEDINNNNQLFEKTVTAFTTSYNNQFIGKRALPLSYEDFIDILSDETKRNFLEKIIFEKENFEKMEKTMGYLSEVINMFNSYDFKDIADVLNTEAELKKFLKKHFKEDSLFLKVFDFKESTITEHKKEAYIDSYVHDFIFCKNNSSITEIIESSFSSGSKNDEIYFTMKKKLEDNIIFNDLPKDVIDKFLEDYNSKFSKGNRIDSSFLINLANIEFNEEKIFNKERTFFESLEKLVEISSEIEQINNGKSKELENFVEFSKNFLTILKRKKEEFTNGAQGALSSLDLISYGLKKSEDLSKDIDKLYTGLQDTNFLKLNKDNTFGLRNSLTYRFKEICHDNIDFEEELKEKLYYAISDSSNKFDMIISAKQVFQENKELQETMKLNEFLKIIEKVIEDVYPNYSAINEERRLDSLEQKAKENKGFHVSDVSFLATKNNKKLYVESDIIKNIESFNVLTKAFIQNFNYNEIIHRIEKSDMFKDFIDKKGNLVMAKVVKYKEESTNSYKIGLLIKRVAENKTPDDVIKAEDKVLLPSHFIKSLFEKENEILINEDYFDMKFNPKEKSRFNSTYNEEEIETKKNDEEEQREKPIQNSSQDENQEQDTADDALSSTGIREAREDEVVSEDLFSLEDMKDVSEASKNIEEEDFDSGFGLYGK